MHVPMGAMNLPMDIIPTFHTFSVGTAREGEMDGVLCLRES